MIISDGITDIEFEDANESAVPKIDKSINTSASGAYKTQVGGERLVFDVSFHCTPAELRSLITLLTNGANYYYYTPEREWTDLYPSLSTPFKCLFGELKKEWDNYNFYVCSMQIQSLEYM